MSTRNFPYTMEQVAALLPLRVRHRKSNSLDVDCPFCKETHGKMNINLGKQGFNCNRCRVHGGMVELYAKYYNVSHHQAHEELIAAICCQQPCDRQANPVQTVPRPAPQQVQRADAQTIDQTMRCLLELLPLTETHRRGLLRRGLTEEQIGQYLYRSTPAFGYRKLAGSLLEMGCQLEGVPGFYQTRDGDWTLACNPKCTGFFVPVISMDGLVRGCQIRLDHPFSGRKYIWFTSTDRRKGTSSGSPVHFVGDPAASAVLITEGALKATIAHCLSGRTFLAIAGANQYTALEGALEELRRMGCQTVYEALDMDKFQNPFVQQGSEKLIRLAQSKGFSVRQLKWDASFKGIDDYYLAKKL